MQNFSYVLRELGKPWLDGLHPAAKVGAAIKAKLAGPLQTTAETSDRPYLGSVPQRELEEEERRAEADPTLFTQQR